MPHEACGMKRTDWKRYYESPFPASVLTRAVVRAHLLRLIGKSGLNGGFSVAEFGGGGSSFCGAVKKRFRPAEYTVYDSCRDGIAAFLRRNPSDRAVCMDLLKSAPEKEYDLVFSVGMIEHFPPEETAELVRRHFEAAKPGGYVILLFPTPTVLYRLTRRIAESCGLWSFPDERAVEPEEVRKTADLYGEFLEGYVIRANILSQYAVLYRKERK